MFTRRGSEVSVVGRGLAGAAQACAETQILFSCRVLDKKLTKREMIVASKSLPSGPGSPGACGGAEEHADQSFQAIKP